MPAAGQRKTKQSILLAESDVIVRLSIADHLRACSYTVLEAATASEAKAILQAGQTADVLLCDAQLAGDTSGFALAKWVRRHRSKMKIILTATLFSKAMATVEMCGSTPRTAQTDAGTLTEKIRVVMAERSRRMRRPASSASIKPRPRIKRN